MGLRDGAGSGVRVSGFVWGVLLFEADGARLDRVTSSGNLDGVHVSRSVGVEVDRSVVVDNGRNRAAGNGTGGCTGVTAADPALHRHPP